MGKKNSASKAASQQRKDEQSRQAAIRAGTTRINSIFDGGKQGVGAVGPDDTFDQNGTYYDAAGNVISSLRNRAADNGNLYRSFETTPGAFGSGFFDKQRTRYIDYATPQLDDQYHDAQKELSFSLARSGLLDSSVRGEKASDLQKMYDLNKQKVADDALSYSTQSRTAVENARADLVSMLNATGDANAAASSALARANVLSQPAAYSPLSQLFGAFTDGLGAQAAAERSYAYGAGPKPTYTTGLFGTPSGAVRNS